MSISRCLRRLIHASLTVAALTVAVATDLMLSHIPTAAALEAKAIV